MASKIAFLCRANGAYAYCGVLASTLAPGWHHLVATYDGAVARLYVDSVNVDSTLSAFPLQYANNNSLIIGGEAGIATAPQTGAFFPGKICEVAVYPSALTAAQVLSHYLFGVGRKRGVSSHSSGEVVRREALARGYSTSAAANLAARIPANPRA